MNIRQRHLQLGKYILDQFSIATITSIKTLVDEDMVYAIVHTKNADGDISPWYITTDSQGNFGVHDEHWTQGTDPL